MRHIRDPVLLICIDNCAVTRTMLQSPDVLSLLPGRTVVQMSTGTPKEAREASHWFTAQNVAYLDGAILAGPSHIGTDAAQILLSGHEVAHERSGRLLDCLGGTVRYLGTNVGAASALDLAWLSVWYGEFISIAHAAVLCKSEGARLDEFISLFPNRPTVQFHAQVIHDKSFDECGATLEVWGAALQAIQRQGVDAKINTGISRLRCELLQEGGRCRTGPGGCDGSGQGSAARLNALAQSKGWTVTVRCKSRNIHHQAIDAGDMQCAGE